MAGRHCNGDAVSAPYSTRLASALAAALPDDVTVTDSQGLLVIVRGNASAHVWPPSGDKRRAITSRDVDDVRRWAANSLARDVEHYVPRFVAPARELVAILRGESL
jgi:hypothetical protein